MKQKKPYDPKSIEAKWQKYWQEKNLYQPDLRSVKKPFDKNQGKPYYNLMMFPYPSAEGMHIGNMYAFTGADIHGRYQRMRGFNVFEPIGLDGFGIHSENYAIKIGKHPSDQAKVSQKNFYRQLRRLGNGYAWDNALETYDPDYYRWTQWLFVQMFKNGLAYRKKSSVNWCPSCQTVLADEQVEGGICERCKTPSARKETEQWFFRITKYAGKLLKNIEKINWPEKIKIAQKNWIGKSEGVEISWKIAGLNKTISTFTTRLDTIFGATFIVLAPDHPLASKLSIKTQTQAYISRALEKTEQQRKSGEKQKTGAGTGNHAIHPLTGKKIPIWIADFVLADYGTGAIMGVPAHDERDRDFAAKYQLPIIAKLGDKQSIFNKLKSGHNVRKKTNYHLRDWLISRQRYWGPPIPMIYCQKCDWQPVPEEQLPVLLPRIEDYQPAGDGKSPLEKAPPDWLKVICPECGGPAGRETDVSDTFLDSSWYFLAYPNLGTNEWKAKKLANSSNNLTIQPFNNSVTTKWLPVNAYIGGAEHAVLHLLYSRFVTMALKDWGYLSFDEPFPFLYGHGLIIKDGAKMSKSRGNIVNPDDYLDRFGADTLRMYLMFIGPYDQGGDFRDTGIAGMYRFLEKIWRLFTKSPVPSKTDLKLKIKFHQTIQRVTCDIAKFKYNTAIAILMEFVNVWEGKGENNQSLRLSKSDASEIIQLFAPFAPHLAEEIWQYLGNKPSVHFSAWPDPDQSLTFPKTIDFPVQINGKTRAILITPSDRADQKNFIVKQALSHPNIKRHLKNKKISQQIFIAGKIINFVV